MVPLFKRLEHFGLSLDGLTSDASFFDQDTLLLNLNDATVYSLLNHHVELSLEYNVLCCQLARRLKHSKDKETQELLYTAFLLSQLLEHLYFYYLNIPHEVEKFYQDKDCLRGWLIENGYSFDRKQKLTKSPSKASKLIREGTAKVNRPRALIIRIKNVLDAISRALPTYKAYYGFVSQMDAIANPIFSQLAWIFFVPRLSNNLFQTFKHIVPGSWMSKQEMDLGWRKRLTIQLDRRGFELANDVAWLSSGLMNAFVLVGTLAPIGVYLTVALYAFDVLMACLKAIIDLNRLYALKNHYSQSLVLSVEDNACDEDYYDLLNERIKYETIRLSLGIATTGLLLVGICLTLPFFVALTPILPLVGLSFIVLITVANILMTKYIERFKPSEALENPAKDEGREDEVHRQSSGRHGLFAGRNLDRMRRTLSSPSMFSSGSNKDKPNPISWNSPAPSPRGSRVLLEQ